jgi:hypothetical protein
MFERGNVASNKESFVRNFLPFLVATFFFLRNVFFIKERLCGLSEVGEENRITARVARFFLIQHTKTGKNYQNGVKYTKWPLNMSNGRNIDQNGHKTTNTFHC